MSDFQAIKPSEHQSLTVSPAIDWAFIANQHHLSVTVNELLQAASSYPLFFIENSETKTMSIAALTSFALNSNVLANDQGEHQLAYIPFAASAMPFALGMDPDNDKNIVPYLNMDSNLVGDENGKQLFENEQPTDYFKKINQQLEQMYYSQVATGKFIKHMKELGVIQAVDLVLSLASGENSTLTGLYYLDEEKLNSLEQAQQTELLAQGYYGPIYAMLSSLTQINRLIQGHAKLGEGIVGVKLNVVNKQSY
ncbi:SapC family protein [Colwellia sp. MEBiC06753]